MHPSTLQLPLCADKETRSCLSIHHFHTGSWWWRHRTAPHFAKIRLPITSPVVGRVKRKKIPNFGPKQFNMFYTIISRPGLWFIISSSICLICGICRIPINAGIDGWTWEELQQLHKIAIFWLSCWFSQNLGARIRGWFVWRSVDSTK